MTAVDDAASPPDRRLPGPVRAILVAVGLAVAGLGGGSLLGTAVGWGLTRAGVELSVLAGTVLQVLLLQGVTFVGITAAYLRLRGLDLGYVGVDPPDLEGWITAASGYVIALVLAVSMVFLVVFLLDLTPAQNRAAELGQRDPRVFLALFVLAFVVIGPGEELLFRGLVQGRLRETFSAPVGIGLATAIFAAAHAPALAGPTSGVALTVTLLFFPALVFGVVYERTGTVVVPALAHGLYNATLFALAYVSVTLG